MKSRISNNNRTNSDIPYYYSSVDSFNKYLELNCSTLAEKLAIARQSQTKHLKLAGSLCTPYKYFNTKNKLNKVGNKIIRSKQNLTINEYMASYVRAICFFGIHMYILTKANEAYDALELQKRIQIFNYILKIIEKYKDDVNYNKNEFIELLKVKLDARQIPKGKISSEFYDLVYALTLLSKDQLVRHYEEYMSWVKQLKLISIACLRISIEYFVKCSETKIASIVTRSGHRCGFDLSKSLAHLDLTPGDRISTLAGMATIIGLMDEDKLWMVLDEDTGASYYDKIKTKDDLDKISRRPANLIEMEMPTLTRKLIQEYVSLSNVTYLQMVHSLDNHTKLNYKIDVSQQTLSKFKVHLFDSVEVFNVKGIVLGVRDDELSILSTNKQELNFIKLSDLKLKITNDEINLFQQSIINMLASLRDQLNNLQLPKLKKNDDNIKSEKNQNVFHDFNYYMLKLREKKHNDNDKCYSERLLIFYAILDFLKKTANRNEDYSLILRNNLKAINVPKGYFSKHFSKQAYSLTDIPYTNLVKDYLSYADQIKQNTDFLVFINQLLLKLFKILTNQGHAIPFYHQNGKYLVLDTTMKTLSKFNCDLYSRIRTKLGDATVIGVDGKDLVFLLDNKSACATQSKDSFEILSEAADYSVDFNQIDNVLPKNINNVFFPTNYSGIEQNECFSLSHEYLSKNNLGFLSKVKSRFDEDGFILGISNDMLIIYWDNQNNSKEMELTGFNISKPILQLSFIDNNFEFNNVNQLIKLLFKLGYSIRKTLLSDNDKKITFRLDFLKDESNADNKFNLFHKHSYNKGDNQYKQIVPDDNNSSLDPRDAMYRL